MKQEPEKKKKASIPKERAVYVLTEEDIKRNEERESTRRNKELFLKILETNRGIISIVCQKTGIARATYYNWRRTDKEFDQKVEDILRGKPEMLEDILYMAAAKGDMNSARFIIAHTHPDYKKKAKNDKDSVVHIYHHVDKPPEKKEKSFYEVLLEDAARRHGMVETLQKEFKGRKFPPKPDGTEIKESEMYDYRTYVRDWFYYQDKQRKQIFIEEES